MLDKRVTITMDGTFEELAKVLAEEISRQLELLYKPNAEQKPDLCSVDEVAKRIGVCAQTVRNWLRQGKVKKIQLGRRVLVNFTELEQVLMNGK